MDTHLSTGGWEVSYLHRRSLGGFSRSTGLDSCIPEVSQGRCVSRSLDRYNILFSSVVIFVGLGQHSSDFIS